jgi:uncharacterized alkaline shock family protein YloU
MDGVSAGIAVESGNTSTSDLDIVVEVEDEVADAIMRVSRSIKYSITSIVDVFREILGVEEWHGGF